MSLGLVFGPGCVDKESSDSAGDDAATESADETTESAPTSDSATGEETGDTMGESTRGTTTVGETDTTAEDTATESSGESSDESTGESTAECEPDGDDGMGNQSGDDLVPNGGGFIPVDDIPDNACDIFAQDCPVGEKCVPYGSQGVNWDADKCVTIMGDQMVGEPCVWDGIVSATDDCDGESACWNMLEMDGEQVGTCSAFCGGDALDPLCPQGTQCFISNEGSIAFCLSGCNPLLQDCSEGNGCYNSGGEFTCAPTTADIPEGESCGFINDCAAGLMCLGAENVQDCGGSACCASFCDLDCPNCGEGTECTALFEEGQAPLGHADVGLCTG